MVADKDDLRPARLGLPTNRASCRLPDHAGLVDDEHVAAADHAWSLSQPRDHDAEGAAPDAGTSSKPAGRLPDSAAPWT